MNTGFVYVVRGADLFKIGSTCGHPNVRIATLQAGSPVPLALVCMIRTTKCSPLSVERALHERYREQRQHREWFALSERDIENISGLSEEDIRMLVASVPTKAAGRTELMAFRLPADLAATIRAQAVGDLTITDVVIRMLRSAPVRLNYFELHDGAQVFRNDPKLIPQLDAVGPQADSGRGKASVETWRSGRKPLLKPSQRK